MLPLRDNNPTLRPPIATIALIAANAVVWILIEGMGAEPTLDRAVCNLGLIPGELLGRLPPGATVQLGPGAECKLGGPDWLTPLSSMFMHGSWLHLIGNMWFLWVFGNNVEDVTGRVRFVVFYLICGLAAAASQVLSAPSSAIPMVGASGAIGGVMGAYVLLFPHARVTTFVFLGIFARLIDIPAIFMLGYWFLLQVLSGTMAGSEGGGVAFWAHVGGFLTGLAVVRLFTNPDFLNAYKQAGAETGWA
jgi:membrane associated rhomboid family serine protease